MLPTLHGPVLLAPEWESAAFDALARLRNHTVRPPASAVVLDDSSYSARRLFTLADGIAIIGVSGLLVDKLGYIGWGCVTGYDGLRCQLAQAFDDPEVKAIALDIDSGGGDVSGCFDLVDWMVEQKVRAGKPMAAILTETAYSAAYAIATAADSIAVPRTGGVGSIGAMCVHWDYSAMLDREGLVPSMIYSGRHKVEGNPLQALPDDVRARWQTSVDELRTLFAETVVRNRKAAGASLTVEKVLGTEARCFAGPSGVAEAVQMGLADAVMAPDQAFAALVEHVSTI